MKNLGLIFLLIYTVPLMVTAQIPNNPPGYFPGKMYSYYWDSGNSTWVLGRENHYEWNHSGKLVKDSLFEDIFQTGNLIPIRYEHRTHDTVGLVKDRFFMDSLAFPGSEDSSRYRFHRNAYGDVEKEGWYRYGMNGWEITRGDSNQYVYDAQGRITSKIWMDLPVSPGWPDLKWDYAYDSVGNIIEEVRSEFQNGNWEPQERWLFEWFTDRTLRVEVHEDYYSTGFLPDTRDIYGGWHDYEKGQYTWKLNQSFDQWNTQTWKSNEVDTIYRLSPYSFREVKYQYLNPGPVFTKYWEILREYDQWDNELIYSRTTLIRAGQPDTTELKIRWLYSYHPDGSVRDYYSEFWTLLGWEKAGKYVFDDFTVDVNRPIPAPVVRLWPNPAVDRLNLELPKEISGEIQLTLHDLSGRAVREFSLEGGGQHLLPVSGLPAGMYLLRIDGNFGSLSKRIVIAP